MARTRCGNGSRPSSGARARRPRSCSENGATADSAPPAACITKQAQALGVDPALVLDGSIVYAGTPGEVFVFRRGNDPLIVVVADTGDTCRLLVSQLLHQGT